MMTLQNLLDEIRQGTLFPANMFVRDDLDDVLDEREEPAFEQPWLECSKRVEAAWEAATLADSAQATMDEVRKETFLVVSRATEQHEIASYVSDDFELICKSLALEMNDPYATGLLESYRRGEIPR